MDNNKEVDDKLAEVKIISTNFGKKESHYNPLEGITMEKVTEVLLPLFTDKKD